MNAWPDQPGSSRRPAGQGGVAFNRFAAVAWLALLVAFMATGQSGQAADAGTFTPEADLKGDWGFTANPTLPNVLLIGDSISIGYTRAVRERLQGKANVYRPMRGKGPDNCGDTTIGLQKIEAWLGQRKWDVIHFNWGLWDLCYRNPAATTQGKRDKAKGTLSVPLPQYERNLEQLVTRLKATGAKLIWATTTVVPEAEAGRFVGDERNYNAAAARVMQRHGIPTDDLFALTQGFGGKFSTAPGDVHYTAEGYRRIAAAVAESVAAQLPAAAK